MSPKKHPTIWKAEPHTIAKIEILQEYLKAWFSIMGTNRYGHGQDILYIDGFAGPGEYKFSDADVGQQLLFRFDDPEDLSRKMFAWCRGTRRTYEELMDYTLNETPKDSRIKLFYP